MCGLEQESHAQLSLEIELCSLVLCFDLRITSLIDSKPCKLPLLTIPPCMALVLTT
jgi:hypothetical protein